MRGRVVAARAARPRRCRSSLIWLPYQAWRIGYYGSFFPNTYYAKVAYLTYYERGWHYLRELR